jgi:hypothetical protein
MTNESKRKDDEKAWRSFLELYIKRLADEVDQNIEQLNHERKSVMKANNPR